MIMEGIDFVVALVYLLWKVVACLDSDMVLLEEFMLLENFVNHEWKTCFLKYIAEHEYIELDLVNVKVIKSLIKLILGIVKKLSHL